MSTDTLDMKWIAKNVVFGELDTKYVRLYAKGESPITLDFKATNVNPPLPKRTVMGPLDDGSDPQYKAQRTLIMQARRDGEELWGIRMVPSCRLLFQPGTGPSRESLYGYVGDLSLGVSFNPLTQALSIVVREAFGSVESFNFNAHSPWASAASDYEILLGAPREHADRTMEGWTVDFSFRYGPAEHRVIGDHYDPTEEGMDGAHAPAEPEPLRGDPEIRKGLDAERKKFIQAWNDALAREDRAATEDTERHWEAMLALASGRHLSAAFHPDEIASEAQALLNAHNAWKEGRS